MYIWYSRRMKNCVLFAIEEKEYISLPTPTLALHGKTIVEEKEISFQAGSMYTLHALLEKSGESLFPENPHKIVFLKKIIFFISTSTYSPFTLNMTKFVIQFTYAGISGSG